MLKKIWDEAKLSSKMRFILSYKDKVKGCNLVQKILFEVGPIKKGKMRSIIAAEILIIYCTGLGALFLIGRNSGFSGRWGSLFAIGCIFAVIIPGFLSIALYSAMKRKTADLIGATILTTICCSVYLFYPVSGGGYRPFGTETAIIGATTSIWLCKALAIEILHSKRMRQRRQLFLIASAIIYFQLCLLYFYYIIGFAFENPIYFTLILVLNIVILEFVAYKKFPKYFLNGKFQKRKIFSRFEEEEE